MNLLLEIAEHKKKEVLERKALFPTQLLERSVYFNSPVVSLSSYLKREGATGIIAEFKRRSPSKGEINSNANIERTSIGYMIAGASALSILTDSHYFGGKNEDLIIARRYNYCPILRKDFIIDPYQIIEARSIGADAVLLIAALLSSSEVKMLSDFAATLGLEVLLEVHEENEMDRIADSIKLVGINNRNLKTFEVDLALSEKLFPLIPKDKIAVAESGINTPEEMNRLRNFGFSGFLIGESFMKNSRPEKACSTFIEDLKQL